MTVTTKALEALDAKAGRVHTFDDYRRVGNKAFETPDALTNDDITIIEAFGGPERAAAARARQVTALNPPAAVVTKSVAPTPPTTNEQRDEQYTDRLVKEFVLFMKSSADDQET